mmetsp:Transcript_45800/g.77835  ORF Transcript_45800/g.77835 Transcript_45800/m.77835 type:complete len:202 (-) Transcript_45800:1748-2353(-)
MIWSSVAEGEPRASAAAAAAGVREASSVSDSTFSTPARDSAASRAVAVVVMVEEDAADKPTPSPLTPTPASTPTAAVAEERGHKYAQSAPISSEYESPRDETKEAHWESAYASTGADALCTGNATAGAGYLPPPLPPPLSGPKPAPTAKTSSPRRGCTPKLLLRAWSMGKRMVVFVVVGPVGDEVAAPLLLLLLLLRLCST